MTKTADDERKAIENFRGRLAAIRTALREGQPPKVASERLGQLMDEYDSEFKKNPDGLTDDECSELVAAFNDAMEDGGKLMDEIDLLAPPAGRA